jgi:hypothetical protein
MSPDPKHILLEEPWSFQLFSNDAGELYLTVLCGSVGLFELCLRLDEDEISRYREIGDGFIRKLATEIVGDPGRFAARGIGNPDPHDV